MLSHGYSIWDTRSIGSSTPPPATTAAQRLGAAGNILMPWRDILPNPDGVISAVDRKISSNQYGSI